jgi:hypothetical protein
MSETALNTAQELDFTFSYMFLSRLQMDLDYYLGAANRSPRRLYYGSIEEHMKGIKKLLSTFPDHLKPEWFTEQDLLNYETALSTSAMR